MQSFMTIIGPKWENLIMFYTLAILLSLAMVTEVDQIQFSIIKVS